MKPLLSVIITSYNREQTISRAIESILAQTFTNFELIIMDDCSKDKSFEIAQNYSKQDTRIRVYKNNENQGLVKNKYLGYTKTCGDYFVFLDSDDYYTDNNFFKKAIKVLKNDDYVTMLLAKGSYVTKKGNDENDLYFNGKLAAKEYIKYYQIKYNRTIQGAMIFKKNNFEQARLKIYNDQMLDDVLMVLLGASENGYVYALNENVINYEMQSNSASKNVNKELIFCHIKGTKMFFDYYKNIFSLSEDWLDFQLKILLSFYAWSYGLKINNLKYIYSLLSDLKIDNKNKVFLQYIKDSIYLVTKGKHDHDEF